MTIPKPYRNTAYTVGYVVQRGSRYHSSQQELHNARKKAAYQLSQVVRKRTAKQPSAVK